MNFIYRLGTVSKSALAIVCLAGSLAACTSQDSTGTAGHGGTSGGAGTTGSAGTTGGAGTGGGFTAADDGIACPAPAMMLTDFTYVVGDGAVDTTQVRFGTFGTTLSGGEYGYVVTSNVTGNDWHIMGTVNDYAGFALYFDVINGCNKFDASAFGGITFTVWGTVGAPDPITLGVQTLDDSVIPEWLASKDAGAAMPLPGHCTPTMGNGQYYHPGCNDPAYTFSVTGTQASPQTVNAKWTDFSGGMPTATVTPTGIIAIYWRLPWMVGTTGATPYDVDIHLDNLGFLPR